MKRQLLAGIVIALLLGTVLVVSPALASHSYPKPGRCNSCPSSVLEMRESCGGGTRVYRCSNTGQNPYTCECKYGNCVDTGQGYYG